ncbi:hypothetical protein [Mycobacterium sherrisii]|uniref:Beta-xylosidase n=1 Tax=Mycobacterium sherrisii TaxID=243061 RepID=A0A1E3SR84_9MYCO|nr:hypothetical protein [Mycobacterium sherrisii]MCV7028434.1 hypothetical protein [Mycobacterium sherrisii]MEC4764094.1 hypothetical protein [Mycobacterium sherrisii]ODR04667.1 hypothetical protein BHQ21_16770 [Mycobacterium sherrisii]ORW76211.1 hypothetical protein AWC25_12000 [Mycobacterium sherrisii]
MPIFDRFNIGVVACAGLCGAAIALSPDAVAVPYMTGGGACMYGQAGEAGGAPAAGGPAAAAAPCAAPLTDMAGVPLVVPGPGIVPVPAGAPLIALGPPIPPVPLGAPLPLGAPPVPIAAPLPLGAPLVALGGVADGVPVAPLIDMAGAKDAPSGPPPTGGPVDGQPVSPGPSPVHGN